MTSKRTIIKKKCFFFFNSMKYVILYEFVTVAVMCVCYINVGFKSRAFVGSFIFLPIKAS